MEALPISGVISSEVFQLFTDNFDFNTLEDLLINLLVFNPFNLKIGIVEKEEILVPSYKGYYIKKYSLYLIIKYLMKKSEGI